MSESSSTSSTRKKGTSVRIVGQRLTKAQRKEAQEKFLKSFASNGNVRAACLSAGIDRSTVHRWNEHDEQFSMQYNLAKEDVNDTIRGEIFRRAMIGDEKYVVSGGMVVEYQGKPLTFRAKSDTLLIFHAKARMPEYRDKQHIDVSADFGKMAEQAKQALLNDLASLINDDKAP